MLLKLFLNGYNGTEFSTDIVFLEQFQGYLKHTNNVSAQHSHERQHWNLLLNYSLAKNFADLVDRFVGQNQR